MASNQKTARDEMFQLLVDAALPVADVKFRWEGKESVAAANNAFNTLVNNYWLRSSTQIVDSPQDGFTMDFDRAKASYKSTGILFIQVFAPRSAEGSFEKGSLLADAIRDIYRNVETASGVVFRKPVAKPIKADDSFWRWNVIVEFEFCELN